MYENAVIKKFETSQIEVISTEVYKITGVTILLYILPYILLFVGFYELWKISPPTTPLSELEKFGVNLLFTVMCGTMILCMLHLTDVWKQAIPSYRVYLKGISGTSFDRSFSNNPDIYITKTTPEQDQIEICKAAQTLEPYARESDKSQATIKKIAENCK
jgi:hypothetical protein